MSQAPWGWVKSGQATMDRLGFPRDKTVHVFPWHTADYNCGQAGHKYGGVNCTGLAPREYCADGHTFCFNNITSRGYTHSLPYIELGQAQGYVSTFDPTGARPHPWMRACYVMWDHSMARTHVRFDV